MKKKLENILAKYVDELDEARNVSNRADALICIKELLVNMNMYADYTKKINSYE